MAVEVERLDEESKGLLRRIVECQAYRQLMAANIRGHGLKFVTDLEDKILLAQDLEHSLLVMRQVADLYGRLGGEDLASAVRQRMERIPYPTSRMELAICKSLTDRAERVAAAGYVDGTSAEFAAIARSLLTVDRSSTRRGEALLGEFCQDRGQRPHAQQMFDRWLAVSVRALGRPGTSGDARAVALGLRTKRCADSVAELLADLAPLREACGLELPAAETLGVDLPKVASGAAGR
jgi:1,2-phenylacetyl-CoA epoxidase catalytic subunit